MERYMKRAFELAKKARPFPNPRVGAVIVNGGRVVGAGYHKKAGLPHAEAEAMEDARAHGKAIKGATLYVTLEPCSHKNKRTGPCTKAIVEAGIGRVVFAMKDPNPLVAGGERLREAGIVVVGPTNQKQGERLNRRYVDHISKKPFVAIKMAMSADGRTATKKGDSKWISCEKSRRLVYSMRAEFDAVLVGAGTVKIDDPALTAHGKGRDPYRIIVDGDLCIQPNAAVLRNRDGKTILATSENAPKDKIKKIKELGADVFVCGKKDVDMRRLILGLSAMGIKKILIEGGSELNSKAVEAGIVDKFYFFIAPKIIGGRNALGAIGGKGIERMAQARELRRMEIRRIGKDLLLTAELSR